MLTISPALSSPEGTVSRLFHLCVLAVLLLLSYLSFVGVFTSLFELIVNAHIEEVARAYIHTTEHQTTKILDILSAIKSALAVLQSSDGGISFIVDVKIQLGQILNVIVELVDRAWIVSFVSKVATEGLGLLLDLSKLSTAPVLTLFFVALGIAYGIQRRAPRPAHAIIHVARLTLFVALVVHFVIPLSIYATAALGHYYFHGQKEIILQGFESVHAATPKHELGAGLHDEIKSVIKEFKLSQAGMHGRTSEISRLTENYMVLSITEHLLVPLVFLSLFWVAFRQFLAKLWSS